jgi:hypothetical protein
MSTELTLKSDSRLEFAYGRVLPGREKWMVEEYFGTVGPKLVEHGFERLVGAQVLDTNVEGLEPVMAVFCAWPTAANRAAFQKEPIFVGMKTERDEGLEMSDGHLFEPIDETIVLNTENDYAVVIADEQNAPSEPIFSLPLSGDSPETDYDGKSIVLLPWGEAAEELLNCDPSRATVFRLRFEPSH